MLEILLQAAEYLEKQEASKIIKERENGLNSNGYSSGDSNSSLNSNGSSSLFLNKPSITQIQKRTYQTKRLLNSNNNHLTHAYARIKLPAHQQHQSSAGYNLLSSIKRPFGTSINKLDDIKRDKLIHNTLEKNRRAHLKECFENLQNELPQFKDKKVTNLAILNYTYKYVQQIRKKESDYLQEKNKLEAKKERLQTQLAKLKQELDSENIDYSSFIIQTSSFNINNSKNDDEYDEGVEEQEEDGEEDDGDLDDLAIDDNDYDTSTSTASEIQVDSDNQQQQHQQSSLIIDEDYEENKSQKQVKHKEFLLPLKRIHKYSTSTTADESTDSVSSDLTLDNYNLNNNQQQQQRQIVTKQHQHQTINPLTAAAVKNYLFKQQQQQQQQNQSNNTTSITSTNLQLTREFLQKALLNDKSHVNIKHFQNQVAANQQQQQQQQVDSINKLLSPNKRGRSSRPATVNQLLTNQGTKSTTTITNAISNELQQQQQATPTVILKTNETTKQIIINQSQSQATKIYTVNKQ